MKPPPSRSGGVSMHLPSTEYANQPSWSQDHGYVHCVTPFLVYKIPQYG